MSAGRQRRFLLSLATARLWALFCLAKGAFTFWMLQSRSLTAFVVIKNSVIVSTTVIAVAATVWASMLVARK